MATKGRGQQKSGANPALPLCSTIALRCYQSRFLATANCCPLESVRSFWNILDCIQASLYLFGFCCKRLEEARESKNADRGDTESEGHQRPIAKNQDRHASQSLAHDPDLPGCRA